MYLEAELASAMTRLPFTSASSLTGALGGVRIERSSVV